MKTLSKRGKYALRALYCLGREYGKGPILIANIAATEQIPRKFLELILLQMRDRGIVASKKGKGGGYVLAKPPEEITLGSVIRIIDGPLAPLPCASETAYRKCDECVDEHRCGTKLVMRQVRDAMSAILDHTTIADVNSSVKAVEEDHSPEDLMYYI
ncbi:MAG: Rrf2 family transcriptional regulator [Bryobacteraceae bacterium]